MKNIHTIENIENYNREKEISHSKTPLPDSSETVDNKFPLKEIEENSRVNAFVMTIEIDKNESKSLRIYQDSIPEKVAFQFCKENNLDYIENDYLVKEIKKILDQQKIEFKNKNKNIRGVIQEVDEEEKVSLINPNESLEVVARNHNNDDVVKYKRNNNLQRDEKKQYVKKVNSPSLMCENQSNSIKQDNDSNNRVKNQRNLENEIIYCNKKPISEKKIDVKLKLNDKVFPQQKNDEIKKKREKIIKSFLELKARSNKRLRDIKSLFSHSQSPKYINPPPIFDLSFPKKKKFYITNSFDQSTNVNSMGSNETYKFNHTQSFKKKPNKSCDNTSLIPSDSPTSMMHSNSNEMAKKRSLRLSNLKINLNNHYSTLQTDSTISTNSDERHLLSSKRVESIRRKEFQYYYENTLRNIPSSTSNQKEVSIGIKYNNNETLYNKALTSLKLKEKHMKQHFNQIFLDSNKVFTTPSSQSIQQTLKDNAFKKMFLMLDLDEDKIISMSTVNLKKIPENIKKIIAPIISQMTLNDSCIDEECFIKECNMIFKRLSNDQQKALISFTKKPEIQSKSIRFDPNVNLKYRLYSSKVSNSLAFSSEK